jgi:cephalosporin hydroxylase
MSDEPPLRLFIPSDNRPAPLELDGIPMWADPVSQMSFGERAALEGVLGQLKPRFAIEIGTYEGGSLRFLAQHSRQVHTFDLYDLVQDRAAYDNVTFHVGDSKLLLPQLLSTLEAEGIGVDLALIDGDHSAEGVRCDLENLLASAATSSAVILLHDTMNEETRAGIESVGLSANPKVIYHELDFVPGYEFAGGHFDGQAWGGIGLVVTGASRSPGYLESTAQGRYRLPFELLHDARRLRGELRDAECEGQASRVLTDALQSSLSWRLTEPLRWAKRWLRTRRMRRA